MTHESLDKLVSDKEFTPLFRRESEDFFKIYNFLRKTKDLSFTTRFYSHVSMEAHDLETFLDDYDARNNKKWNYITEIVASTRGMGRVAYTIKHVLNRIPYYKIEKNDQFEMDSSETLNFFNSVLISFFEESAKEAKRLGIGMPLMSANKDEFFDRHKRKFLPHDIDEEFVGGADEKAAEIATKYINVANNIIKMSVTKKYEKESLIDVIPSKINYEMISNFKSSLQPLVSKYDTYIKGTPIENKDEKIPSMRGYTALPLHLIEIASYLTHFYERHEDEIRHEETKRRIAALVNKKDVLDKIVNYSLFYATKYVEEALPLAEGIKRSYIIPSRCIVQNLKDGLHARPASCVAKIVKYHGTEVFINLNGEKFDAGSVITLLSKGLSNGDHPKLVFEGDKRALDDIKILAEHNFGKSKEDLTELGKKLPYLLKISGEGNGEDCISKIFTTLK